MKRISFRKIYNEPELGEIPYAIISFRKFEHRVSYKEIGLMRHTRFVNQYEKWLTIDLWIIILTFSWLTKYKKAGDK